MNPNPTAASSEVRLWRALGPGLIAGASDADPTSVGTYSQAGAQVGFAVTWTMLFMYPLMAAVQQISARTGRTTGHGIAGNIRRHYPKWLLQGAVVLLFAANTITVGADLGAMADALGLLIEGPPPLYVLLFAAVCVAAQIFLDYERYVTVLKWLTLSLFTYVVALLAVPVPWGEALRGFFVPHIIWSGEFFTTLVAIFGTTISPYLFFWQSSQEAEELRVKPDREPLHRAPQQADGALSRIRLDTLVGMGFANLIGVSIILMCGATLHANGITEIESSAQAAEALRPVAGNFAFAIFALGIVATGLLAVPVLAGSTAYAIGEARGWPVGLRRAPKEAKAFYCTLAIATILGASLNFTPINPIRALYWSSVINGIVAVPIMVAMMRMAADPRVMGRFYVAGPLRWLGWAATAAMAISVAAMATTWLV